MNYCTIKSEPQRSTHPSRNTFHRLTKNSNFRTHQLSLMQQFSDFLPNTIIELLHHQQPTTPQQISYYAQILRQENLFPQFTHDLKVMTSLVPHLKARTFENSQLLWSPGTTDLNLYKITRGEINIRRKGENVSKTKAKGDFVQSLEEFKNTKESQVVCKDQCILLQIRKEDYCKALELNLRRRKILQMLSKTSLLSGFKRRQLNYLLGESEEQEIIGKETLFKEGQSLCQKFYFVIEGQLVILKQSSEKTQVVCYVADGNFVGEEVLYGFDLRTYSAVVHSTTAKIIIITTQQIENTLEHFKLTRENVLKSSYRGYLQIRSQHYRQKIEDSKVIKQSFHQNRKEVKMNQTKHNRIISLLRDIQNSSEKLDRKGKLLEKRLQGKQELPDEPLISVEHPLFLKEDFPGLKKYLKKCSIFENRARQNYKLPALL